ncbi:MAG TPA: hypothetical protein VFG20_07360 [Planctomycetaceae bacterium]|nr:hypothetical protein [Planctomycetaceae bacterium]
MNGQGSPPLSAIQRFSATMIAWIIFAALAVRVTWPMPRDIVHDIPLGSEDAATVPLFNLWTVWWNADRAAAGLAGYWDAPIFFPTERTFVFSEVQPTTIVVAPVMGLTGTPVAAYNVYLLLMLWLNGVCLYRLLRQREFAWWPAVCGGMLVQTLPFLVWQLGVLQLTALWPSLWTITALWQWNARPHWLRAVELGVAFAVTYLTCNYYGLFLVLLLSPLAVAHCWRHVLTPSAWGHAVIAAVIAGGLVYPVVSLQREMSSQHGWKREMSNVIELSAHLRDYTNTPWPQWLEAWESPEADRKGWPLGSAWLQMIAAGIGFVCGVSQHRWRRWTLFVTGLGFLALLLSLGPRVELWGISPYRILWDVVPGVAQIRSPFRFAIFVELAFALLAVITIQQLIPRLDDVGGRLSARQRLIAAAAWLPAVAVGAVFLLETRPINRACYRWPTTDTPSWVEYLRDETPAETTIVCLPFVKGTDVVAYQNPTEWMMWGTRHHRRMINGYSGYFPETYLKFKGALEHFPRSGVAELAASKIDIAVVDRRVIPMEHVLRTEPTSTWEWLFSDDVLAIDLYRIHPPPPARAEVKVDDE